MPAPEGTVVFGRGKSREERLSVEFRKAIFPNGETISIQINGRLVNAVVHDEPFYDPSGERLKG